MRKPGGASDGSTVPVSYYEYSVGSRLGPGPTGPAPVPPGRRSCCGYSEELHPDGLQMRLKGTLLRHERHVMKHPSHDRSGQVGPESVLNQGYQGARIREYQDQDRGWGYQGPLMLGSEAPLGIQVPQGYQGYRNADQSY
jgi:hypothetical protein